MVQKQDAAAPFKVRIVSQAQACGYNSDHHF